MLRTRAAGGSHGRRPRRLRDADRWCHPRELTQEAKAAIRMLQKAGAQTVNQCPLVRGVNDRIETMSSLFGELSFLGCPQYYVFQGRPVAGIEPYEVPLVHGFRARAQRMARHHPIARRIPRPPAIRLRRFPPRWKSPANGPASSDCTKDSARCSAGHR